MINNILYLDAVEKSSGSLRVVGLKASSPYNVQWRDIDVSATSWVLSTVDDVDLQTNKLATLSALILADQSVVFAGGLRSTTTEWSFFGRIRPAGSIYKTPYDWTAYTGLSMNSFQNIEL